MFNHFPQSEFIVVTKSGNLRWSGQGLFSAGKGRYPEDSVTVPDTSAAVEPGDTIRRVIPSGREELYTVQRVNFNEAFHGIQAHFVVKLERQGIEQAKPRSTYVHVTGSNARINVNSHDQSSNYYSDPAAVFAELRQAISTSISPPEKRDKALVAVGRLESSKGQPSFMEEYKSFIGMAAEHITVVAPFIPALTSFLGG